MPTTEERLATLEAQVVELQAFRNLFVNPLTGQLMVLAGLSSDGLVPYLQFNARVGICTNYWCLKPLHQGAGLSVGVEDRFAGYFEVDTCVCNDAPSVALYASVCGANPFGQPNHAIEAVAANSVSDRSFVSSIRDHITVLRYEGLELIGNWVANSPSLGFFIGKIGSIINKLF